METVVFTAFSDAGASLGTASVTGNVTYETGYYDKPMNQVEIETLDGNSHTYGNAVYKVEALIAIKGVDYTEGESFLTWLRTKLSFKSHYLGINLNSNQINLGKGMATNIVFTDKARTLEEDGSGVTKLEAPLVHNINFKFKYYR